MTNAASTSFEIPAPPEPGTADVIDEMLVGLPAPPRVRRRVLGALLGAVSVVALGLSTQFIDDVAYAFSSTTPVALGDGRTAPVTADLANRYVSVHAAPSLAGAVSYSRWMFPGEHVVFPVAGREGEPLYVQVSAGQREAMERGEFHGRLTRFNAAGGRYANVGRYLHDTLRAPVSGQTWLLVEGDSPRSLFWAPVVTSLLVALALADLALLRSLFRRDDP